MVYLLYGFGNNSSKTRILMHFVSCLTFTVDYYQLKHSLIHV